VSFECGVVISSHLLLYIFIVHTQSKNVFVIFLVVCVRLYSYCISPGTVFNLCLHVRVICELNYYLLTYLLTYFTWLCIPVFPDALQCQGELTCQSSADLTLLHLFSSVRVSTVLLCYLPECCARSTVFDRCVTSVCVWVV